MRTVLLAAAGLLWSATAHAEDRAPDTTPLTIEQQQPDTSERPMLSQGDPKWKWLPFGSTTVGKSGCTVFALMDVLTDMGLAYASPITFVSTLVQNNMFDPGNNLYWTSLGKLFPITATRLYLKKGAAYAQAVLLLSQQEGVLLRVKTAHGFHWIAAKLVNGEILVRDSNGGRTGLLTSLYGVNVLDGLVAVRQN